MLYHSIYYVVCWPHKAKPNQFLSLDQDVVEKSSGDFAAFENLKLTK